MCICFFSFCAGSGEISVADLTTDRTSPIMANVAPNPPASYLHLPSDPNRMVSRSVDNLQQPSLYHFEPNAQVTNQLTALTADQATLLRPYVDRTRSHSDPLNVAGRRAGWANVLGMVEGSGNQSRRATVPSQHPNMGAHGPIMSTVSSSDHSHQIPGGLSGLLLVVEAVQCMVKFGVRMIVLRSFIVLQMSVPWCKIYK